jgi:hypothetical protein
MENIEIYIRGRSIGEEVVVFGSDLEDIRRTIIKSSALRGFSPYQLETITRLLKREGSKS